MRSSHIFQVPSSSNRLPGANSGSSKQKKRKRGAAEPEDEDVDGRPESREPVSIASLTANQAAQYRLAGADLSDGVPAHPFPHRDKSADKPEVKEDGIASLFQNDEDQVSLRQRHLSVLSTIMHNSLLKGDYRRAGRAWAMLLRSGPMAMRLEQTTMDLHRDGRWEIAAEILLRRRPNYMGPDSLPAFTETGLRAARDFYERLIVQFPIHPNRMNTQIDFYLAMFSLWIYEVTERAKAVCQRIAERSNDTSTDVLAENFDPRENNSDSITTELSIELNQIQTEEIQGARQIATRLDELLSSPPYDKDPRLLHLRGSVALWMGDLMGSEREREHGRAGECFQRAVANGGRLWKA